jgi:hypothetical protein
MKRFLICCIAGLGLLVSVFGPTSASAYWYHHHHYRYHHNHHYYNHRNCYWSHHHGQCRYY